MENRHAIERPVEGPIGRTRRGRLLASLCVFGLIAASCSSGSSTGAADTEEESAVATTATPEAETEPEPEADTETEPATETEADVVSEPEPETEEDTEPEPTPSSEIALRWEQGWSGTIQAGTIRLPEFGGIQFELNSERMVYQDRAFTILRVQEEPVVHEVNLLAPTATPDGEAITTIDELVVALTDFVGADLVELDSVETQLGVARAFDFVVGDRQVDRETEFLEAGSGG
jgi:hypothetical protein